MLSKAGNERVTRVGPGAPMGDMLRQYWLPALLSTDLPEVDGPPLRVKLLGGDLISFRDSSGRVGLVASNCPHRGASLFFGRNEQHGLRCVYHGWKYDVAGQCVDMPNEPAESNFKHKIRLTAYPCRERNGLIWAYMGPLAQAPELPDLEWNLVPEGQYYISMRVQQCNWAQALEGGIDNSHASFLHSRLRLEDHPGMRPTDILDSEEEIARKSAFEHRNPRFETLDTPYGAAISARRPADEGRYYYRITQFLMPFYSMIASVSADSMIGGHAWVPIDDEHTMTWSIEWHPFRPLTEKEVDGLRSGNGIHAGPHQLLPPTSEPGGAWRPQANRSNDSWQDREAMRTTRFTGIPYIWLQD